jgi:Zn-dependent protease with chaperone function
MPEVAIYNSSDMKAFGLSGETRRGLFRLFMTHPSLDEGIEALIAHA